jgi:hypothetical protein
MVHYLEKLAHIVLVTRQISRESGTLGQAHAAAPCPSWSTILGLE